jgi:hypothetical protein
MKLRNAETCPANSGSVLLITMGTIFIMGAALAALLSYLALEHRLLNRTALWNSALPFAEAGIEEAMSHLKQVDGGSLAANGWSLSGSQYVRSRALPNGSFEVGISSSSPPAITSTGRVWSAANSSYIERRIQVTTRLSRGLKGMTAKSKVVISGDVWTDSYDSSDPSKSTASQYDPAKRRPNGFISTNSKVSSEMEITGNAKINGKIATGPGSVLKLVSPARVGDFAWTASSANDGKVQSGWLSSDMNVSFPDVVMPSTAGYFSPPSSINGTTTLTSGKYLYNPNLKLSDGQSLVINGDVTIYVKDTFDMSGQSQLIIEPGARLDIYVQKSTAISGDGIVNRTGIPANFNYYGSKENYQIYYSGKSSFIGTVYAPSAKMDLTGASHFMGASVSNEIVLGGNFQFHYDECLGGDGKGAVIVSWAEL